MADVNVSAIVEEFTAGLRTKVQAALEGDVQRAQNLVKKYENEAAELRVTVSALKREVGELEARREAHKVALQSLKDQLASK